MTPNDDVVSLRRVAERAKGNRFFLASAFALYQDSEELSDEELAGFLGCPPATLVRLALCRRPGAAGDTEFSNDLGALVMRFGVHEDKLSVLIREAEFLEALRHNASANTKFQTERPALLLAAQDRSDTQDDATPSIADDTTENDA